ncbi:hypothetical protein JCM8208_005060 [Rhodotorula glutinis]
MGKVRHRKQTRAARVAASAAPLTDTSDPTTNSHPNQHREGKKGQRRDTEMQDLLDKLRAPEGRDRVFAASTLSSLILSLPPMQLRLLLSRNLIGLLIERLSTLSAPSSPSSSSTPPPSDDLSTAIESLGALRNFAVSSPPHILSEMHNKRLLLPLATVHLPLLAHFLPHQLAPPPAPVKPALPATAEQRRAADAANEAHDTLRRSFWDWTENVLTLVWCLAESNTKILAGLNAHAEQIVALCVALLDEDRLGIDKLDGDEGAAGPGGMDVEGGKALKKKDAKREKAKRLRVPLFVAVAAAQTLHAFISSNPAAHTHLLSSAGSFTFSPSLSTLLSILLTPAPPSSSSRTSSTSIDAAPAATPSSADTDAWAQLRVLAFGSLLEIAKGRSKRRDAETVRDALRSDVAQGVLLGLVGSARLEDAVEEAKKVAGEIDPTALPNQHTTAPDSAAGKLAALERQSQTLQLALEVLSEWLASGLPAAGSFDGAPGGGAEGEEDDEEQEAWGGISMEVEGGDDIDMGASDGEGEDEAMGGDQVNEADGVIRRRRGDTPTADDSMLDDLAATAGDGDDSDGDSGDDDDSAAETSAAKSGALALLSSLPLQLLALSRPTSLSFLSPSSFAPSPLDSPASASAASSSAGLISTSASRTDLVPHNLAPLAEALTTVHVRATEALNNLYVVLSRAGAAKGASAGSKRDAKELQSVFESALQLMLGALEGARAHSAAAPALTATAASGKKGKGGDKAPQQQGGDEVDEVQERRLEVVMAAGGVVWGCVRLGLDPEHGAGLVVGPDTTPFLIQQVYASPFAAQPTPSGEAIRVRTLGALGYLGRRKAVPAEENAQIGRFLLSLLPSRTTSASSTSPSTVASTPDILLQAIDSLIDLYADEEREYDGPVFREGGMLQTLEGSVPGVRAAIKKVDRNKFPELRSRADGALDNLVAFVGYRKDVVKARR